jgi:cyanophycin synthetase
VANPGRAMLLRLGDVSLFVDYAHNPAALAATLRTLHRVWGADRCVAAVTLPGDRRDDLLAACAQVIADGVSRAVLYDDEDPRGRAAGEVSALVEKEMRARRPKLRAVRADGYRNAVGEAVRLAEPGDVVLILYEKISPLLALLTELGAGPAGGLPVHSLPTMPAPGAVASPTRDLLGSAGGLVRNGRVETVVTRRT